jgi:ankyrin repeat protein
LEAKATLLNLRDYFDMSAILWAARRGHTATVKALLQEHTDTMTKGKKGRNLFHHAFHNGDVETLKLFLDARVDALDLPDDCGTAPLMQAALHFWEVTGAYKPSVTSDTPAFKK